MARVHSQASRKMLRFANDDRGVVAVLFAASLIPVILGVGAAIDFGRALTVKSQLQTIVDAAALAGASVDVKNKGSTEAAAHRMKRAEGLFDLNKLQVTIAHDVSRQAVPSEQSMLVRATATVPATFTSIIRPKIEITVTARATYSSGMAAPLCMLSLNKTVDEAFKVYGTADIIAPECAVQSHSTSPVGMVSGGSATATATHFCSAGKHSGSGFSPKVEDDCTPVEDPMLGKYEPAALAASGINVSAGCNHTSALRHRSGTTIYDASTTGGVYVFCGGIQVSSGATVEFEPGVYVLYNYIGFGSGSNVIASSGVTFYLGHPSMMPGTNLNQGRMDVQGGANLHLVAPTTGPLAGMAIVQPYADSSKSGSIATNTIIGGGVINVVGSIYTPQSKLRITGNGTINDTSDYFSVIADIIEVEGNGQLNIRAGADTQVHGQPGMAVAGGIGGEPATLLE